MFKGLSSLTSLMQNAQEISGRLQSLTDELKSKRVKGSAGGGMVEAEANGLGEILRIRIDPVLVERQEREMIEDLLPAAINQAVSKAKELHLELARTAAKDFSIPGLDEALAKMAGR